MNPSPLRGFAAALAVSAVAACAAAPTGPGGAPPGRDPACETSAAVGRVQAVVDANGACSTDADCVSMAIGTSCFDVCTRTVAAAGRAAVEQALATEDERSCPSFAAAGCKLVVPPCAPPRAPTCHAGRCE